MPITGRQVRKSKHTAPDIGSGSPRHEIPRGSSGGPECANPRVVAARSGQALLRRGRSRPNFRKSGTSRDTPAQDMPKAGTMEPVQAKLRKNRESSGLQNLDTRTGASEQAKDCASSKNPSVAVRNVSTEGPAQAWLRSGRTGSRWPKVKTKAAEPVRTKLCAKGTTPRSEAPTTSGGNSKQAVPTANTVRPKHEGARRGKKSSMCDIHSTSIAVSTWQELRGDNGASSFRKSDASDEASHRVTAMVGISIPAHAKDRRSIKSPR